MILKPRSVSKPWSPEGFEDYHRHYPNTAWKPDEAALALTTRFIERWHSPVQSNVEPEIAVVLTPGLFAECLPQCFSGLYKALVAEGRRVHKSRVRTTRGPIRQAPYLQETLLEWLKPDERFIWCTHSKGGLDALWVLHSAAMLRDQCRALIVFQLPVGNSWILERCLHTPMDWKGKTARILLQSSLGQGCRSVTSARDTTLQQILARPSSAVSTLQVISWSVSPTSWVDSYHQRLNQLRPGWAHDGQFYLDDQLLPSTPTICLPRLDHAQPVLGGQGLNLERLWRILLGIAVEID